MAAYVAIMLSLLYAHKYVVLVHTNMVSYS